MEVDEPASTTLEAYMMMIMMMMMMIVMIQDSPFYGMY
jgi:hypothetical protein